MSYVAKCSLCNKVLRYRSSNTSALVRHMIKHHPKYPTIEPAGRLIHSQSSSMKTSSEDYKPVREATNTRKQLQKRGISKQRAVIREFRTNDGKKADENLPDRRDFIVRRPISKNKMYYKTTGTRFTIRPSCN